MKKPHESENILLIALYEKGILREDISNLLITAKKLGMYVIGINTLKLKDPDKYSNHFDTYIERPNFGRDFGSYKYGFMHIFKRGLSVNCERLVLLNDSLFYSKDNLSLFLEQMSSTDKEVLGACENFEFMHHLGSFAIGINKSILQHNKFRKYWYKYKNTDVRPLVIKRGELGLSKALKRSSITGKLDCLYNKIEFSKHIAEIKDLKETINLLPKGHTGGLGDPESIVLSPAIIYKLLYKHFFVLRNPFQEDKTVQIQQKEEQKNYEMFELDDIINSIMDSFSNEYTDLDNNIIIETIRGYLIGQFSNGSQIHRNALFLIKMKCPIIKLDLLYRGVFRDIDIIAMSKLLNQSQQFEFLDIIFSRPYGAKCLTGIERAKFSAGLI